MKAQQLALDVGVRVQCRTRKEYVRLAREHRSLCEHASGCEVEAAHLMLTRGRGGWVEVDGRRLCWEHGSAEIEVRFAECRALLNEEHGTRSDEAPARWQCMRCRARVDHDCRCHVEESHEPNCPAIIHSERVETTKRGKVTRTPVSWAEPFRCTCGKPQKLGPLTSERAA